MPIQSCQLDGKSGYKYGQEGKCYTYNPDDKQSKQEARSKAIAQGKAIEVSKTK